MSKSDAPQTTWSPPLSRPTPALERLQGGPPLEIGLAFGPVETVDEWRRRAGRLSPETPEPRARPRRRAGELRVTDRVAPVVTARGPAGRRLRTAHRALAGVAAGLLLALTGCDAGDAEPPPPPPAAMPPGTDVWVAALRWNGPDAPVIETPSNLTGRPGYDNQPHFVPDGSGFWYTAVDEHVGQADIWRYDFATRMVTRITASSPESEYSATPLPDGSGISVVRVEADSTQRLWRFDLDGGNASVVLEDVAPVGYHAWASESTVVMFVLGDPATLRRADVRTGEVEVVAQDVGRSIQRIPGSGDVSFVQRDADGATTVMRLPSESGDPVPIVEGVEGGEDHAWAPDGTLLMARGSIVYAWTPGGGWRAVADFSALRLQITRLAVSPDGSQIALVGEVVL